MADLARIKELAAKWLNGAITEDEKQVFEDWYNAHPDVVEWTGEGSRAELRESMLSAIMEGIAQEEVLHDEAGQSAPVEAGTNIVPMRRGRRIWVRVASVAAVLVLFFAGYWLLVKPSKVDTTVAAAGPKDLAPGKSGAILTLTDGTKIVLDSTANGAIARQGNTGIVKQNGQVIYKAEAPSGSTSPSPSKGGEQEIAYNTMSTPKARQYSLVLADGSKVWLNAESSIRYPTAFTGKERVVEVTGEAYFEVVHNAAMPFRVKAGGQIIEDIGTSFNVNSYPNEPFFQYHINRGVNQNQ